MPLALAAPLAENDKVGDAEGEAVRERVREPEDENDGDAVAVALRQSETVEQSEGSALGEPLPEAHPDADDPSLEPKAEFEIDDVWHSEEEALLVREPLGDPELEAHPDAEGQSEELTPAVREPLGKPEAEASGEGSKDAMLEGLPLRSSEALARREPVTLAVGDRESDGEPESEPLWDSVKLGEGEPEAEPHAEGEWLDCARASRQPSSSARSLGRGRNIICGRELARMSAFTTFNASMHAYRAARTKRYHFKAARRRRRRRRRDRRRACGRRVASLEDRLNLFLSHFALTNYGALPLLFHFAQLLYCAMSPAMTPSCFSSAAACAASAACTSAGTLPA